MERGNFVEGEISPGPGQDRENSQPSEEISPGHDQDRENSQPLEEISPGQEGENRQLENRPGEEIPSAQQPTSTIPIEMAAPSARTLPVSRVSVSGSGSLFLSEPPRNFSRYEAARTSSPASAPERKTPGASGQSPSDSSLRAAHHPGSIASLAANSPRNPIARPFGRPSALEEFVRNPSFLPARKSNGALENVHVPATGQYRMSLGFVGDSRPSTGNSRSSASMPSGGQPRPPHPSAPQHSDLSEMEDSPSTEGKNANRRG